MNLVLIGMRCTGKTAIGRWLAHELQMPFIDTDERVESEAGRSITEIFKTDGEDAFRDLETQAVKAAAAESGAVISTGGGVVLRDENVRTLRENGLIIHLVASPQTIHARMQADESSEANRPALTDANDSLTEIRNLWAARRDLYTAARDVAVSTEIASIEEAAEDIMRAYLRKQAKA